MTACTIEAAAEVLLPLAQGTSPSLLHALRGAALTPRMHLACSTGYARSLYPLRSQPLPEKSELLGILDQAERGDGSGKPAWGRMGSHVKTLYAIDALWFSPGLRERACETGTTLEEQRQWRCWMNRISGMGFKCLSWALFIYDPLGCQLLALDSWHARRLEVDQTTLARDSRASHAIYEQFEDLVIADMQDRYPDYPPTFGAACEWFNLRRRGPESHVGFTCREREGVLA